MKEFAMGKYAEMMREALQAQPETVNKIWPKNQMPAPPYTPGNTYLHLAANGLWYPDDEEVIRVLLEFGADPNIQNDVGWTALHYACDIDTRNKRIAELLLQYGARVDVRTHDRRSPIDLLRDGGGDAPRIAELLSAQAENRRR
jgi:hypothetical protein